MLVILTDGERNLSEISIMMIQGTQLLLSSDLTGG